VRRLDQLLGALHAADAVGDEARSIQALLRREGFASEIYAGRVDTALAAEARPLQEAPGGPCLYHFAPGSPATAAALAGGGPLGIVYHNVTPASFFARWSPEAARLSACAPEELRRLAPASRVAVAHSEFSRADLQAAGFSRAEVVPFPVAAPRARPTPVLERMWRDGRPTFLCVGRVVPNKRLEDALAAFAAYQRRHEPRSRLLVIGETDSCAPYARALAGVASSLGVTDAVFCGRASEADLAAAWSAADAMLFLSAHEGYGVPVVEALQRGVPVIARDAGAVRETLRGGGVLVEDASPAATADLMAAVQRGGPLREAVLAGQARALETHRGEEYAPRFLRAIAPLLEAA
jgi:glycosyltransferase involved in cell wall biosynthesis